MVKIYGFRRQVLGNGLDKLSEHSSDIYIGEYIKYVTMDTDWISENYSYKDALECFNVWIDKKIKLKHMLDDDGFYCGYFSNDINLEDESMKSFYRSSLREASRYPRGLSRRSNIKSNFSLTNRR